MKKTKKGKIPVMQKGGSTRQNAPIYTNDPKKVQAYQDSLNAADNSIYSLGIDRHIQQEYNDSVNKNKHWWEKTHTTTEAHIPYNVEDFGKQRYMKKTINGTPLSPYEDIIYKNQPVDKGVTYLEHTEMYPYPKQPYIYQEPQSQYTQHRYPTTNIHAKDYIPPVKPQHSNIQQLPTSQPNQLPTSIDYNPQQVYVDPDMIRTRGHLYGAGTYGMPNTIDGQQEPAARTQYKQGGQVMNRKVKCKNGKKLKYADGGRSSNLLDNPQGQTPTGQSIGMYGAQYNPNPVPQDVQQGFQTSQGYPYLMNDPIAMEQAKPNQGIPGVTPDVIDQYNPQAPVQKAPKPQVTKAGPSANFNTADIVAGTIQGINALVPWQQPKQNRNPYQMAIQDHPYGTGSHSSFKAGGSIHIKKENRGKFNATKKATGKSTEELTHSSNPVTKKRAIFAQNAAKWKHADGGVVTPQDTNNLDDLQSYLYQQHYADIPGVNHDPAIQQQYISQYNSTVSPDKQVNPAQLPALFNDQQNSGTFSNTTPMVHAQRQQNTNPWMGSNFANSRHQNLTYVYPEGTTNYRTDINRGVQEDAMRTQKQWGTDNNWQANNAGTDITGTQHNYNKYYKEASAPIQESANLPKNYTGASGGKNYINGQLDIPIAEGGMMIPAGNGMQIEDGKFKYLSPDTVQLTGPSHDDGGQIIQANGSTVEAEGGETLHVSPVDGSTNVGGNLYIPGTRTKYKQALKEVGKFEAKNDRMKTKITTIANNITDPMNKYGAPTAGSVKVLHDGLQQKEAHAAQVKQYLTDSQNIQLELADKAGVEPQEVTKWMGGKAKWGMKMKKYDDGGPMGDEERRKRGMGAQRLGSEYIPPVQPITVRPQPKVGKRTGKTADKTTTTNTGTYDIMDPYFLKQPLNHTRNQPGIPDSFNQQIDPISTDNQLLPVTNQDIQPQEMKIPDLPATQPYGSTTTPAKKPFIKGARNKFHIGDYLGEISSLFDRPEPVQSMQVNPILEPEYNLSLQQNKNSIISAYKPALQAAGNSPGQQAAIAGQMAEQLGAVDSEELALNQQNTGTIRARNIQELHGVRDANTQLGMQQMDRQAQAKAITEQNRFNAANSVSAKEAARRAQNNTLSMYEQYAGWAYDPKNRQYQMIHPDYQFGDTPLHGYNPDADINTRTKNKKYYYNPKTGKKEYESDVTSYDNTPTYQMGGMMSGPIPGMGTPIATRKKKSKAGNGKKLKYC